MKKSEFKTKYPEQYARVEALAKQLKIRITAKKTDNAWSGYIDGEHSIYVYEIDKTYDFTLKKMIPIPPKMEASIVCTCRNCGDGSWVSIPL